LICVIRYLRANRAGTELDEDYEDDLNADDDDDILGAENDVVGGTYILSNLRLFHVTKLIVLQLRH
jgi:hypothetical protein